MEIKHTVSAFLRAFKSKNTLYQIKLRISYKSRSCEVSTGYSLHSLEAWDNENKCVKPKYIASKNASSTTVNKHIAYCVNIAEDVFKFYEVNNIIPSIKEFLEMYSKKSKGNTLSDDHCAVKVKPKEPSFWEVLHRFMEETGKKNDWAPATYVKYKSLENDLQTFNPNLKFANLTETTLTNFVCFLRDTKKVTPPKARADADGKIPGEKIGLNNSTIEKKISYLRWFLNWAVKKGYCKNIEYQDFKPTLKTAEKPIIYLTEDELKKILNYKIPKTKQYLEKTRDVLHFCCVTGLRYSDACNLRRYNIKEDCIELTTIKTTDKLLIPLNEPAKKIIAKYKKTVVSQVEPEDSSSKVINKRNTSQ